MSENTKIEVGDKVRAAGFTKTVGTVYDVFENNSQQWAQVEWTTKGNQFSKTRRSCAAYPCSALVLQKRKQTLIELSGNSGQLPERVQHDHKHYPSAS